MPRFPTADGLFLHYTDQGTGHPLLCLPGLTRCGRDFDFFAPHARDLRLITLDYRGRGKSAYDPTYANYNVVQESCDVIELLDHLGLEKVSLLGTSRGGLIAMVLAATHAHRLSGVILNDVGPEISPDGIARILTYVGKPPRAKTLEQAASALGDAMAPQFPDVPLSRWQQQAEIQYLETDDGLTPRYDPMLAQALQDQAASGEAPDLWPLFDALASGPLGAIRGANSDILGPKTLADMQRRNPDMLFCTVPNRGHVPFLDEAPAIELIHTITEMSR
ncbi:alpha/beta hydrolase [Aliisedimentitalea scapharcae]|uniref:Alpha/beta hydrolase n=1 Tax=Aliisedimentitalea scapharcae TaxID=1524259 RepID=A0ABZ2XU84_9RHOB